jgi:hypothetical protein
MTPSIRLDGFAIISIVQNGIGNRYSQYGIISVDAKAREQLKIFALDT